MKFGSNNVDSKRKGAIHLCLFLMACTIIVIYSL